MKTGLLALLLTCTSGLGFAQVPYSGDDADQGVSRKSPRELVDYYTGNLAFSSHDLKVAGAVGSLGLMWDRHATSRASQQDNFFGLGHNWAHSWQ